MISTQSTLISLLNASRPTTHLAAAPQLPLLCRSRSTHLPSRRRKPTGKVHAVIGNEVATSSRVAVEPPAPPAVAAGEEITVRAVVTVKRTVTEKLLERIRGQVESFKDGIGLGIVIQIISEEVDPVTNKGKRSVETPVRGWLPNPSNNPLIDEYAATFNLPAEFGRPGAIVITNLHDKEFYLQGVVVNGFNDGPFFFPGNTWIHPRSHDPESRIIFGNQAYLPSQTPDGIKDIRQNELVSLRGNGKGERKKFDRIYDYATYNDLGNPDKKTDLARPVLGGRLKPYPRRCRTGGPSTKTDPSTETRIEKPGTVYVPRDEAFEELKLAIFTGGNLRTVLQVFLPSMAKLVTKSELHFKNFTQIDNLYKQGLFFQQAAIGLFKGGLLPRIIREQILKYELPIIISKDPFSWLNDSEFARQVLAGMNPMSIERLKEFPIKSKLDPTVFGSPESALTKEIIERGLDGETVEEAIEQGRLFILDYHDILLPFIKKINALKDSKAYASRTIFYYSKSNVLRPVAIELTLPPTPSSPRRKTVYTQGQDATTNWLWRLAKAHVCSNDAGVHQLVNHWLRTHACMEPYILSTHRNLSSIHPIYMLLHPHLRYTMEINALARQSLINAGGVIEECFSPGKYAMEISAAAYDLIWRFDMEALPADLIRRGMAVEDPSEPSGLKLVIEDYPYAADGLLVWSAIKEWVSDYVSHFYPDAKSVVSDVELQAWWDEIKNKGHQDKKNEPWWPLLRNKEDLVGILTPMIWVASAHHAAVNFGQYPFGGYMPHRPAMMKRLIPREGEKEYEEFLVDPESVFLNSLPTQVQAMKIMAIQDTLSTHSPDEEYLGQLGGSHANWISDAKVLEFYDKFSTRLEEIEEVINERNKDKSLKNRCGAGVAPYELLLRSSKPGVTGRGIPNSISI